MFSIRQMWIPVWRVIWFDMRPTFHKLSRWKSALQFGLSDDNCFQFCEMYLVPNPGKKPGSQVLWNTTRWWFIRRTGNSIWFRNRRVSSCDISKTMTTIFMDALRETGCQWDGERSPFWTFHIVSSEETRCGRTVMGRWHAPWPMTPAAPAYVKKLDLLGCDGPRAFPKEKWTCHIVMTTLCLLPFRQSIYVRTFEGLSTDTRCVPTTCTRVQPDRAVLPRRLGNPQKKVQHVQPSLVSGFSSCLHLFDWRRENPGG